MTLLRSAGRNGAAALGFAITLILGAQGAQAQDRRVPASGAEMKLSFAPAVRRAAPAVVNVYAAKVVENRNPLFDDPVFRRFFGAPGQREQVQRSLGSGVLVDAGGFVVTNNHVVEGATEVKVALSDKREFEAEIVLKDSRTDLAVLKLKGGGPFPVIELGNSDELQIGDIVLAIGNPFAVGQTVTHGIVSALARTQVGITDYQFFIQTDAAINPGNSGGALIDLSGRLVGINTAIYSRSGGSQGIGFAIPVNMVRVVIASAKGGGTSVKRPWLGASLQAVTSDIAEGLNLKRPTGALVTGVTSGSPAAHAGLKVGDLIVSIDGQTVDDTEALGYRFATKPLGGTARLGVLRGGKEIHVDIALAAAPEVPPRDPVKVRTRSPFLGTTVVNISPAVADEMHIDPGAKGVVVSEVEDGTPAQMVGLRRGDIVQELNGETVTRTKDIERLTRTPQRVWRLKVNRGGQILTTTLGG
ncbi:MAG: Do family serine endopeptidase [Variibacter sp.]